MARIFAYIAHKGGIVAIPRPNWRLRRARSMVPLR